MTFFACSIRESLEILRRLIYLYLKSCDRCIYSAMYSLRKFDLCFVSHDQVCVTCCSLPPARVTLGSFSTRGFTHAAITIITGLRASFRDRATDRCPLTLRRLCSFCEIDLTYSLVYANWWGVTTCFSERFSRLLEGGTASLLPFFLFPSLFLLSLII